jgi:glycosyltransferase involved in cell wall biosynthesis
VSTVATTDELTVVVPARDAAALLPDCLAFVQRNAPAALLVVDGCSKDDTAAIARAHGATVLSDDGRGLPVARLRGAEAARTRYVALVDADVVLPDGSLAALLDELVTDTWDALQAGLCSVAGPGYWGQALTHHHRTGRSRRWFGLVATVLERRTLLRVGFDPRFTSGEDIDLRWRMRDAGLRVGVSERTVVVHRFAGDDRAFARDQFLADGAGLGRMIRTRGPRGWRLAALPAAAAARGTALSLADGETRWLPYYWEYARYNYRGMARGLRET